MSTSIKFKGKEVRNPFLRFLIAGGVVALILAVFAIIAFVLMVIPVLLGIILGVIFFAVLMTVPLHFILRACGRRGFYVKEGDMYIWTPTGAFDRQA